MATFVEVTIQDLPGFDPALVKVVAVKGQLDESNVDEESKKVYEVLDHAGKNFSLILDFKDLEYMNSKAVGYLTDWYTKLTDSNGRIFVVQPKENILDILQVVGLTQLVQVYQTMDEARLALNQEGIKSGQSSLPIQETSATAKTESAPSAPAAAIPSMPASPSTPVQTLPSESAPTQSVPPATN